jgi:hypothetical protein
MMHDIEQSSSVLIKEMPLNVANLICELKTWKEGAVGVGTG